MLHHKRAVGVGAAPGSHRARLWAPSLPTHSRAFSPRWPQVATVPVKGASGQLASPLHLHLQPQQLACKAAAASASAGTMEPAGTPYTGQKAVVVGAGPAGSTAAMVLARQGFTVDVFERRPEPSADTVDTGRAYIIVLIPRGQATLESLGIELPTTDYYKSLGTVRHNESKEVKVSVETGNKTFSRSGLAQLLIEEAQKRYPKQIKFHFMQEATAVDMQAKQATFTSCDGSQRATSVGYDLLLGTDGAASNVRAALQQQGTTVEVNDSGREYKVYMGLSADIEPPEFQGKPGSTLHLYTTKTDSFTTCTAHRNPDGTYSGTFSMRTGEHANFTTQAAYEALLRDKFPTLPAHWVPEIAKQAIEAKPSSAGKRIKCSKLHGPHTLILGDAGHAVTPLFGQGANSALESCRILDQVLTAQKGNSAAVPAAFTDARLKDAHALYWIDSAAFQFFQKRPGFDFAALLSHVLLGTVLSKLVPKLYGPKPALLSLGSTTPYSVIYSSVQRDATAVAVVLGALLCWAALKLLGVL